ncbi:hypothetical protein LTR85_006113 [Meristemomyces frigidus]|nr:hypothetical protein LTR85_006113 [Meristemomyces frigidus]
MAANMQNPKPLVAEAMERLKQAISAENEERIEQLEAENARQRDELRVLRDAEDGRKAEVERLRDELRALKRGRIAVSAGGDVLREVPMEWQHKYRSVAAFKAGERGMPYLRAVMNQEKADQAATDADKCELTDILREVPKELQHKCRSVAAFKDKDVLDYLEAVVNQEEADKAASTLDQMHLHKDD